MSIPASPSGNEQRAWVRYHSKPETPLLKIGEPEDIHSCLAKVHDISEGGLSLHVASPFEVCSIVEVELTMPGGAVTRTLLARVVRAERLDGPPLWLVACAFETPLSADDVQMIAAEHCRT